MSVNTPNDTLLSQSSSKSASKLKALKEEVFKEVILQLQNVGYAGLNFSDVAKNVKMERTNIYYHFENKENIVRMILQEEIDMGAFHFDRMKKESGKDLVKYAQLMEACTWMFCEEKGTSKCVMPLLLQDKIHVPASIQEMAQKHVKWTQNHYSSYAEYLCEGTVRESDLEFHQTLGKIMFFGFRGFSELVGFCDTTAEARENYENILIHTYEMIQKSIESPSFSFSHK